MHVHLVFVTKYRRGVFTKEILHELRPIFSSVCIDFEADLVEFDGEDDHVHLLVNYPPKVTVDSQKGLSEHSKETMGWSSMVTQLFFRQLRWRSHCYYSPVYRAAENTRLNEHFPAGTLTPP
jgi:putative transposase